MKKSMQTHEKRGFSLAEALITLLIVCLITLASIPILTKKRRDLSQSNDKSGKWVCYWHGNQLKSFFYIKGQITEGGVIKQQAALVNRAIESYNSTGIFKDAGCKFIPPPGTKNYVITYVGGGGGGASSTYRRTVEELTSGTKHLNKGIYAILLASAGGSGGLVNDYGSGRCDELDVNRSNGRDKKTCGSMGAPGSFMMSWHEFLDNTTLEVTLPGSPSVLGCNERRDFGDAKIKINGDDKKEYKITSGHSGGCADYDGHNKWRGSYLDYTEWRVSTGSNSGTLGNTLTSVNAVVFGGVVSTPSSNDDPTRIKITEGAKKDLNAWGTVCESCKSKVGNTNAKYPMYYYFSDSKILKDLNLFGFEKISDFLGNYGFGGRGNRDGKAGASERPAVAGGPGLAKLVSTSYYSGRGGEAGKMPPPQIVASITSGLWALPGKGGHSGSSSHRAGFNGNPTYVDRFPVAEGGSGAPEIDTSNTATYNKVCGGSSETYCEGGEGFTAFTYHTNYVKDKLGGFALLIPDDPSSSRNPGKGQTAKMFPVNNFYPHGAGTGGGGGGIKGMDRDTAENNDFTPVLYNGGQGASGAVIIEW